MEDLMYLGEIVFRLFRLFRLFRSFRSCMDYFVQTTIRILVSDAAKLKFWN